MNKNKTTMTIIDQGTTIQWTLKSGDKPEIKKTFTSPDEFIYYLKRLVTVAENAYKKRAESTWWTCEICGTTNMLNVPICQACFSPRKGGGNHVIN